MLPMVLSCMLYCNLMTPTDAQIMAGPSGTGVTGATPFTPSPLYQWMSMYFAAATATPITFSNLVRGMQYNLRCIASSTQTNAASRTTTSNTWTQIGGLNIATPPGIVNSCIPFGFSGTALTANQMNAALNYCQYFFSMQNSGLMNPACIVCSDSRGNYPAGVAFTAYQNVTCQNNVTPYKSSKLRFLSGRRSLQTPNTTNQTNTTAPAVTYYNYSLCPVQNPVCASDAVASGTGTMNSTIQSFVSSLNSATNWQKITGVAPTGTFIPAVQVGGNYPSYQDVVAPGLNFTYTPYLNANVPNSFLPFSVAITNVVPAFCYWYVLPSTSPTPTPNAVQNANVNTTVSGSGIFNSTGLNITIPNNTNTMSNLPFSTTFTIWAVCYNNIPAAVATSNVTAMFTFTSPTPTPATVVTNCTGSTNCTACPNNTGCNTTTNTTAGSFITYAFAILLTLVFIF